MSNDLKKWTTVHTSERRKIPCWCDLAKIHFWPQLCQLVYLWKGNKDATIRQLRFFFFPCHLEHACPPLKNLLLDRARFSHISANLSLANLKAYHASRKTSMYSSAENHNAQDLLSKKVVECYFQHFHMCAS